MRRVDSKNDCHKYDDDRAIDSANLVSDTVVLARSVHYLTISICAADSEFSTLTSKRRRISSNKKQWHDNGPSIIARGCVRVVLPTGSKSRQIRTGAHDTVVERGNSHPAHSSSATSSSHTEISELDECSCKPIAHKIRTRIHEARMTVHERRKRKCEHSYSKLSAIVILTAFHVFGNRLVHKKCLFEALPVSTGCLSARHREAVKRQPSC